MTVQKCQSVPTRIIWNYLDEGLYISNFSGFSCCEKLILLASLSVIQREKTKFRCVCRLDTLADCSIFQIKCVKFWVRIFVTNCIFNANQSTCSLAVTRISFKEKANCFKFNFNSNVSRRNIWNIWGNSSSHAETIRPQRQRRRQWRHLNRKM